MSREAVKQALIVCTNENAVFPTKGTPDSIGYDLTAISVYKTVNPQTILFDTGLQVKPPEGYYTEILPRSSLTKSGYVLANSVGVIDPDYRGNLLIALTKVVEAAPNLTLPFKLCQLVLRKVEDFELKQVQVLDDTVRGDGGFGSTDKK